MAGTPAAHRRRDPGAAPRGSPPRASLPGPDPRGTRRREVAGAGVGAPRSPPPAPRRPPRGRGRQAEPGRARPVPASVSGPSSSSRAGRVAARLRSTPGVRPGISWGARREPRRDRGRLLGPAGCSPGRGGGEAQTPAASPGSWAALAGPGGHAEPIFRPLGPGCGELGAGLASPGADLAPLVAKRLGLWIDLPKDWGARGTCSRPCPCNLRCYSD